MKTQQTIGYRAKWIFPVVAEPIENGIVVCRNQKIIACEKVGSVDCDQSVDLGDVAIIPGLVNAHTHLEFSDLEQPLGDPSLGFPAWIEAVIAHRRGQDPNQHQSKSAVIARGIQESKAAGVVAVGEIATLPTDAAHYDSELHGVVFHEQLGNDPLLAESKTTETISAAQQFENASWQAGVSPHAPYSTSLNLFRSLTLAASKSGLPITMHLAETLEEIEFIETGKGPFAEMLQRLGVEFNRPAGSINTSDYLTMLGDTNAIIAHGNYLNVDELELVAESKSNIAFCPRTHSYFGHAEYPLRTMLDLKINVAVGTDSRASNPDLDLFSELVQIAGKQPSVSPAEILRMGTMAGALALRLEHTFGSIESGKSAKLCVVSGKAGIRSIDCLFDEDTKCRPIADHVKLEN